MDRVLFLKQGSKYSDEKKCYFMVPNWFFDEGEYIDLTVYEKLSLMYIVRLVNKKDNSDGKGDVFYLSAEQLRKVCGFSIATAKRSLTTLANKEYIKCIAKGSNLNGKANTYRLMNLQPEYMEGEEIEVDSLKGVLSAEEYNKLLLKCWGVAYYYPERCCYSHRKRLPLLIDIDTGELY